MAKLSFLILLILPTLFHPTSSNFISTPAVLSPSPPLEHPPPLHHAPAAAPSLPPSQHHHHHHHHAPAPSPHHGPHPHAPVPAPAPAYHEPVHPLQRRFIAVQGVVYCKSCKYAGSDTLLGASPLLGAAVKLECNNTKYRPSTQIAKTDKNGYFYLET